VEEAAVADRVIDAGEVLKHHPSRANGEVPDLRVALLAIRKTDGPAAGREAGAGPAARELVEVGSPGQGDGVTSGFLAAAPSVANAEDSWMRYLIAHWLNISGKCSASV
jgi:hypothetical protein